MSSNDPFQRPGDWVGPGSEPSTIEYISNKFETGAEGLQARLNDALEAISGESSTPTQLAAYQTALSAYTLYRSSQSNTVKALKDICAGTISNFR